MSNKSTSGGILSHLTDEIAGANQDDLFRSMSGPPEGIVRIQVADTGAGHLSVDRVKFKEASPKIPRLRP